ncbi:MAG: adenylate/guanylate cyclase domain-containing protein [Leptospirales bacterium]
MQDQEYDQLFHFKRCEFSNEELDDIAIQAKTITQILKKPGLEIPLQNLMNELFRYSFRQHFLNIQADFIDKKLENHPDQETHGLVSGDTFTNICEEKELPVELTILKNGTEIIIDLSHYGKMPEEEMLNIRNVFSSIEKSLNESKQHQIYSREQLTEKFSSGIHLALLSLLGIGIAKENFQVATTSHSTQFRIILPFDMFEKKPVEETASERTDKNEGLLKKLFTSLQYTLIEFDLAGNIKHVDGDIFKLLDLKHNDTDQLLKLLPSRFFEDIIWGPFSIKSLESFENYRVTISGNKDTLTCLFNISGVKYQNASVVTLWQAVNVSHSIGNFSDGAIFENINIMKIVRPYIPHMILDKARDCIRKGLKELPNERKEVTVLFADLIGFTQKSESLPHNEVIGLLNLTMSTIVQSIERYSGYVDKFIGDGIMCVFMEPLSAVISAIEIQNNLLNLNEFRKIGGQDPLELRIGINTGKVILGSIGIKSRMDWTALGDVVNTASRIEKVSKKYAVLIGDSTFKSVEHAIEITKMLNTQFKGKKDNYAIYYVKSAIYEHEGKEHKIELNEESTEF